MPTKPAANPPLWDRTGEALESFFDASSLSLRELAGDLNVSHETLRKWVKGSPIGSRHVLTVARVAKFPVELRREVVAYLLDVEVEDLVELLEPEEEEVEPVVPVGALDYAGRP